MRNVVVALLVIAAGVAVLTAVVLFRWITSRRAGSSRPVPPLVIPVSHNGTGEAIDLAPLWRPKPTPPAAAPPAPAPPAPERPAPAVLLSFDVDKPPAPEPPAPEPPAPESPAPEPPALVRAEPPRPEPVVAYLPHPVVETNGHPPGGETVRFFRPTDEPVQLLPGRLEVLAGTTRHREIRFVRIPGEPLQLFLGRDPGPSPQYIGLGASTVSRRHARFAYADGRWHIKNLSQTNPVVVNNNELSSTDSERALVDGDRVELGEVVLVYHAQ